MFHPFGWGFGGGYGYGPGYPGAGGWGAPGYSPLWSLIGILVDLLVVGIVVLIVMRFFRRIRRANGFGPGAQNRSRFQQGPNAQSGGFGGFNMFGRSFNNDSYNVGGIVHGELVEQDVADACCEFVANRERCRPEAVDVELLFDDDEGFAADIRIAGRFAPRMMERDLVDAIAEFVAAREGVAPQAVEVNLEFNERLGVYARTQTRR
jgi:hypothetical protein